MFFVELSWEVLAGRIPAEMIAAIRQLHIGMRTQGYAWTRESHGTGFRSHKACDRGVQCPTCCSMISLPHSRGHHVLRFSEDDVVIMQNLVRLKEKTGAGAGALLDQVRRMV